MGHLQKASFPSDCTDLQLCFFRSIPTTTTLPFSALAHSCIPAQAKTEVAQEQCSEKLQQALAAPQREPRNQALNTSAAFVAPLKS
jgi:hypothetical protein